MEGGLLSRMVLWRACQYRLSAEVAGRPSAHLVHVCSVVVGTAGETSTTRVLCEESKSVPAPVYPKVYPPSSQSPEITGTALHQNTHSGGESLVYVLRCFPTRPGEKRVSRCHPCGSRNTTAQFRLILPPKTSLLAVAPRRRNDRLTSIQPAEGCDA